MKNRIDDDSVNDDDWWVTKVVWVVFFVWNIRKLRSMSICLSDCAMTFASHVVTTACLKCHISIKIFITIYLFILTWYKHISDTIVWFHCISMKNILLREVACSAGLASDDSNMSTWSSHPCFTTRVIYKHETRRMRSYARNGVYHCKISPTSFDPCIISIFIAYFRPKLSCHSFVAKTEITTGTSI